MVTDDSQQVVWKGEYDPFGEVTETVALVEQNLRFPGQYFDVETGLHYNYFRSYDPGIGKYVESDPIGLAGGLSTYGYVEMSPLTGIDPYGLERWNAGIGFSVPKIPWLFDGGGFEFGLFTTDGEGEGCIPDIGVNFTVAKPLEGKAYETGVGKFKAGGQLSYEPNGGRGDFVSVDSEMFGGWGIGGKIAGLSSRNYSYGIEGGVFGAGANITVDFSLSLGDFARVAAAVFTGDYGHGILGATSTSLCECQ